MQIYLEKSGGVDHGNMDVLAAGARFETVEGDDVESVIICKFPSFKEAHDWYHGDYRHVSVYRQAATKSRAYIVEGLN